MSRSRMLVLVASLVVAVLVPTASRAQVGNPFDHLKCYKVKDPTKAKYVADLVPLQQPPFQVEPGCAVKFPAKLFCIPVQKRNVQPVPPGGVNGAQAQDYLVYQIKCDKNGALTLPVTDQFAARTIGVGKHQFRMVPAFKQSNLCHNGALPGTPPVCAGDCTDPDSKCALVPGTTICECRRDCSFDAAGNCKGTCPFTGQACQIVSTPGAPDVCTCDPRVDTCHLDDPATGVCGGECADPTAQCLLSTNGICECEKPCGPTGLRRCGGTCPTAAEFCRPKPDDSGCECAGAEPQPCGFLPGSEQCGGVCPRNLVCVHTGPVPGGSCACGVQNQ